MSKSGNRWLLESLASCDVLVVGATTGAVAAALDCRRQGLSVRVVSDLTHLGEDTAGRLDLWAQGVDRTDPLVAAFYPADHVGPVYPSALKRTAELALLREQIPFLYGVRPVSVLRTESGAIGGLLLAARSSVFAIRCGTVIDASRFGVVARLAKLPMSPRRSIPASRTWTVIADAEPAWPAGAERVGAPMAFPIDKATREVQAWRLKITEEAHRPEAFGHLLQAALLDPSIRVTAETLPVYTNDVIGDSPLVSDVARVSDAAFTPAAGLVLANALLPLDGNGAVSLDRPDVQAALGRRAAARVRGRVDEQAVLSSGEAGHAGDQITQAFLRQRGTPLEINTPAFPVLGQVDVAVAGGGTGGAPAGIAAARAGAKTVVLEVQSGFGGVGTLGLIASYWFGNRVGFTAELDKLVEEHDGGRTHKSRWNPHLKMSIYHRLLRDAGGDAWMRSFAFGTRVEGGRATGLLVSTPFGAGVLEAGCIVDATGNADVAAAAGAPCKWIGADHVACQGTGLSPINPARDYRNSDHTFIDDTDPEGVTHAQVNARAKFTAEFDTSALVNSRERRQIIGDVELSPLDILACRTFPDTIVTASSNFDTHGFTVHPVFFILPPDKKALQAHVPFRAMLPRGLDGVLVTGLGTSAHRDALPVIRMQADVQNQGFAAGQAAAVSAREKSPLRSLDVRALQAELVRIGNLDPAVPSHGDSFPLPADVVGAAADAGPTNFWNGAVLFANFEKAQPLLRDKVREGSREGSREGAVDAALVLGLQGDGTGLDLLIGALKGQPWDTGWNYKGMGQFGMSSSRMDAIVLAIGRIGDKRGVEAIEEKIRQITSDTEFSHSRSVAIAAACLREPRLSKALLHALQLNGMTGHAHLETARVIAQANSDMEETASRNVSLRELYLARGLYLCGDIDGLGRRILETYARDLRGQFARHARAVLGTATTTAQDSAPASADRLAWS